jgi:aryl-alcohol dehydrogenase-like predicted oxidoreductase
MRLRRLGRTGLALSELTLGTAGLRGTRVDPAESAAAFALALASGINAVELETGDEAAAALIGETVKRTGGVNHIHVLSRIRSLVRFDLPSPHVHAQRAYPGAHIRTETESLLQRLGIERLALLHLHAWCPEWLHEGDWLETLERLRDEGKIGGIGISLWDHDVDAALEVVGSGVIDSVQLLYNIFDPGAAARLLPLCGRQDVGVIARSPLYFGTLSEQINEDKPFAQDDWRNAYFFDQHLQETRLRVRRLAGEPHAPRRSVAETALRFCVSHPVVSTVAIGMLSRRHVEANLRAIQEGPLDRAFLQRLALHKWLC